MATNTLTNYRASPAELQLVAAISSEGFEPSVRDGWFYPPGQTERALVRLSVYGGQYQICRRRSLTSPWMVIATRDVEDFDSRSFHEWRETWPLTV